MRVHVIYALRQDAHLAHGEMSTIKCQTSEPIRFSPTTTATLPSFLDPLPLSFVLLGIFGTFNELRDTDARVTSFSHRMLHPQHLQILGLCGADTIRYYTILGGVRGTDVGEHLNQQYMALNPQRIRIPLPKTWKSLLRTRESIPVDPMTTKGLEVNFDRRYQNNIRRVIPYLGADIGSDYTLEDDTAILVENTQDLRADLNTISTVRKDYNLNINVTKTKLMIIEPLKDHAKNLCGKNQGEEEIVNNIHSFVTPQIDVIFQMPPLYLENLKKYRALVYQSSAGERLHIVPTIKDNIG
ncbi:hypothetical protein HZH68_000934 [Vespula germanica]|uniref:Uncharacterized protein n=1 Tax=Vespula germanica TaxID=30212 RepID=A0A834NUU3_VESGE|nr:hypothetical protein HZH68_000934 [Vespula germanica]